MIHIMFQDHRTSGSQEDLENFGHIWAWWPSCSCDDDRFYKFMSPFPKESPHKI